MYLRFERESNAFPKPDLFEQIADFCLRPLRFGRQFVLIKNDARVELKQEPTCKLARVIAHICSIILFPMTLVGMLACTLSSSHKAAVQKLNEFLAPKVDEKLLFLLKERNLYIKIIGNSICREGHDRKELLGDFQWDYLIKELKDPQGARLERRAKKAAQDRLKYVFDAEKRAFVPHVRNNFYQGTNKTSLTLLPANAKTALAATGAHVGLLFDARECQARGKYVFANDGVTHAKWWLAVFERAQVNSPDFAKVLDERLKQTCNIIDILKPALGSLDKLRQQLAEQEKAGYIAHYNEVLASVVKEAIVGIFARLDASPYAGQDPVDFEVLNLVNKVAALSRRAYLKEELGLTEKIYLKDQNGLRPYPQAEQKEDLEKLIHTPSLLQKYAQHLTLKRQEDNKMTSVDPQELCLRLQELLATV